ncbi:MAG TPA: Na+/H+ antiporter NhaA [Kofleriaceae bacterium]|jgi:NhaA family Na+:H+ antiporter
MTRAPKLPIRRVAAAISSLTHRILAVEAASGIALLAATIAALVIANMWSASYAAVWSTPIGGTVSGHAMSAPLKFWIDDGAMTIFFFVVGLEIRREIHTGELASLRQAALPFAAALGGMLAPAIIYAVLNVGRVGASGWAIPMATDIAFAVGVLTLLGSRVSPSTRVLLLALAVIDDIGAIVVIGIFFSAGISLVGLAIATGGLLAVVALRSFGVRAPLLYVPFGIVVWAGLLKAGVHPTIGGVLLGLLAPVRPFAGEDTSVVDRLIRALHPWVAFVIMPVFALANAGVVLGGASFDGDARWIFIGIVAGLAIGKPLGIAVSSIVSSRLGLASRSAELTTRAVLLVGLAGGIGFTMSLFLAQLALPAGPLLDTAKLAILVGSAASMLVAIVFGAATTKRAE